MLEIYYDKRGEVALENLDDLMQAFPRYAQRAIASAMKSEGFRLKSIIQDAVLAGGPDGHSWPNLNPHTGILNLAKKREVKNWKMVWKGEKGKKKRGREYKEVMLSTRKNPLSKLRGAVRYIYDKDMQLVRIGFVGNVSRRMLALVHRQAEGYETPVTPKMRKRMFALGNPLKKSTNLLKTPARPLIAPVFRTEKENVTENLKRKYLNNVIRYMSEGVKKAAS